MTIREVTITIPVNNEIDLSTKREPQLDLQARIVAMQLGFKSVRHFEIAAKQALITASIVTPTPNKKHRARRATPQAKMMETA